MDVLVQEIDRLNQLLMQHIKDNEALKLQKRELQKYNMFNEIFCELLFIIV